MPRIRANYKLRVFFHFLVVTVALSCYRPAREKDAGEWRRYQREFKEFCREALSAGPNESTGENPSNQAEIRRRTLTELAASKVELKQVVLPDADVRDLCTTCHLGINNPLFDGAPEPFRTHPGKILEQHKVNEFGCTLCHQGHGEGTTVEAAHGTEENWPRPLIPTKYVQSTCAACHETSFMLEGAERLERGRRIFISKGCYACHAAPGSAALPQVAGPLDEIGTKLSNASWLSNWIREPAKLRPQTLMPNSKLADDEVGDLTAYLFSLKAEEPPKPVSLQGASADRGEGLFVERGCRGCHSAKKDEPGVSTRVPNLSGIGLKVTQDWLMTWLEGPRFYNPDTLMPKTDLTEEERLDLTAYLMTLKSSEEVVKPEEDLDLAGFDADNGKKLAEIYGCYGCHVLKGFEQLPPPGAGVAEMAYRALNELPFGETEIARTKWDWVSNKIEFPRIYQTEDTPLRSPVFAFEEGDVESLTTYYLNNAWAELPEQFLEYASHRVRALQQGDWLITAYNCRGCHMLEDDQKAVIADHLEPKFMVPPSLVGEGEKVQPQWLYEFMRTPSNLRPWLQMRMPDFGLSPENNETLVRYLSKLSGDSGTTFPYIVVHNKDTIPQEEIEMGEYRVRTDKCVRCHPVSLDTELPEDVELEDLSIDLLLSKNRLRFEWIKDFLRGPDKYAGVDTKMPFVYYDPDGRPKIPDPKMWIDLTAKFLMVMEELPEPVEETLEEIRPGSQVDWTSYDY